jgi:phosphate-selective porin OprO and OprP
MQGANPVRLVGWLALAALAASLAPALFAQEGAQPPKAGAGADGFSLRSGDGEWTLRFRALLQLDGRAFDSESAEAGDSEWLLRRVRPTFEGTFGDRVAFRLVPDFGNGHAEVPDAWVDLELAEDGPILRAGKFKPPVGMERLRAANHLQLIERSIVTELVPKRDIGVQISGGDRFEWAAGLFNGVIDGGSGDEDPDGKQDFAVRFLAHPLAGTAGEAPFKGLALGVAASYGSMDGSIENPLLPGYRSPGQKVVFGYRSGTEGTFATGERLRVSPQLYWYRGPFGLMGEAVRVSQDVRRAGIGFDRAATLEHDAWELTLNWFLTGEPAGFRDPNIAGSIELVARASALETDEQSFVGGDTSFSDPAAAVRRADTRAIGVNWWPVGGVKGSLSYQRTGFTGGAIGGDRIDERVLLARLQLYF